MTARLVASSWFQGITGALAQSQVTDREGADLGFDAGSEVAASLLIAAHHGGKKALLLGNGGSAAIVSHMHNDLAKAVGMRALVFQDVPLLTAISNDHGYVEALERGLSQWAEPGDIVIAVSSSGASENILRGVRAARERGAGVVTYSGFSPDNPLRKSGDVNFYVPSRAYGVVEGLHMLMCHFLSDRACEARPPRSA